GPGEVDARRLALEEGARLERRPGEARAAQVGLEEVRGGELGPGEVDAADLQLEEVEPLADHPARVELLEPRPHPDRPGDARALQVGAVEARLSQHRVTEL